MRAAIQPKLNEITATCACGGEFELLSTTDKLRLDICSKCHPFFTGQQRFVDTEGRIDKFRTKFGSNAAEDLKARFKAKKTEKTVVVEETPKVSVSAEVAD